MRARLCGGAVNNQKSLIFVSFLVFFGFRLRLHQLAQLFVELRLVVRPDFAGGSFEAV